MIEPSAIHLVAAIIGAFAVVILALAVFLPQGTAADCRSGSKTEDQPASPLAARVPISEIRDGLIVRRDGSFCAGWECSGVATQFASAERLEAASTALDVFIKSIRHPEIELQFRYVIDYETPRVLEARKALGCANSPAAWLEENRLSFWRSAIDAGQPGDPGGVAVIHAVGCREEAPVFLPLSDLEGHMLVSGATRTGKTHYLQIDLVQAIERGTEAVIFIDPKGDLSVLHRAYDAAVRTGRQKDFQFFSLAFPHVSCTYNPLHNFVLGMEMPDRLSGLCSLAEGNRSRSRRSPGRSSTSSLRRCCLRENARCYRRSRATRRSTAAWKNCFRKFPSTPRNTNICRDSSSIRLTTTTRWSLPLSPCCRSWTRPISGI